MYTFELDPKQLKVMYASIQKVENEVHRQTELIPKEAAQEYRVFVYKAVLEQTYSPSYDYWADSYLPKKKKSEHPDEFLRNKDKLLDDIKVFNIGSNKWTVGPMSDEVKKYAYAMEYGYAPQNIPARPIYGKLGASGGVGDYAIGDYMKSGMYARHFAAAKQAIRRAWVADGKPGRK